MNEKTKADFGDNNIVNKLQTPDDYKLVRLEKRLARLKRKINRQVNGSNSSAITEKRIARVNRQITSI